MSLKVITEVTTPRNHIMRRVLSAMLGVRFELTPPTGEGILSPAAPPNRQRQRGGSNAVERIEAHTHLKSRYHERYHGPAHALDRTPLHLLYLVPGLL